MMRKSLIWLGLAVALHPGLAQDSKENADFKLALNLYNDRFYDLALEQFRQFISFYPTTQQGIEARYYLGLSQVKLGRFDEARATFQNFAVTYPDHPKAAEAWVNVAEAFLAERNRREAAVTLERIRTFHPRSRLAAEGLQRAASLYDSLGDRSNALRVLKVLTQEYSAAGSYAAQLRLAELYAEEGQLDNALQEVRAVVSGAKEPGPRAAGLVLQADLLHRRGRVREAEAALQDVLKNFRQTSSAPKALALLGSVRAARGDYAGARESWEALVKDVRAEPAVRQRVLVDLGQLEAEALRLDEAMAAYEQASRIAAPLASTASYRAGRIAERNGDTLRASQFYERAATDTVLTADRSDRMIAGIKAARWMARHDLVALRAAAFERSGPDDPSTPRVLLLWGMSELMGRNDPDRAVDVLRRVVAHPSGLPVADQALLGLARAYRARGDADEAVRSLESLISRFPASSLRSRAEQDLDAITTFEVRDRDAGTAQLALLLGDVISEQSRSTLAYRLGEISFLQLKNYALARDQFRSALAGTLDVQRRPEAWYRAGRSSEFLARAPGASPAESERHTADALAAYDSLRSRFPAHPLSADAFSASVRLRAARATAAEALRSHQRAADSLRLDAAHAAEVMMVLADRTRELGFTDVAVDLYGRTARAVQDRTLRGEAQYRAGELLSRAGSGDTVLTLLRASIADGNMHRYAARAGLLLAQLEAEKGNADRVAELTRSLLASFPASVDTADALLVRADAAFAAADAAGAAGFYAQVRQRLENDPFAPRSPETATLFRQAVSLQRLGRPEEAMRVFGQVIARNPAPDIRLQSLYAIAAIAEAQGDLGRASAAMQEAALLAQKAGGNADAVVLQSAELLFRNEQYTQALAKFADLQKRAASDTARTALEARIIVCYFRLDNLAEADRRATAFVRSNPRASAEAAEFEFERAKHLTRKGELTQARRRFDIVVRQYPRSPLVPEAMFWLGRTYELGEQPDSAALVFEMLMKQFPNDPIVPRVQLGLGNVYYALEQWDKAVPLFKALLDDERRAPDLVPYAMNNLILTYKELTLFDAALQLTRTYIDRFPDDPDLINKRIDIGVLYQRLGYYDQSVVHLQDLMMTAPSEYEAELRYYIGEAHYYKGDYQQGILEFLKVPYLVTRRGPIDWVSTSYYMAGQSYEKLSRFDQAVAMYKQIVDRPGIDASFKTAAQREIDRVNALVQQRR